MNKLFLILASASLGLTAAVAGAERASADSATAPRVRPFVFSLIHHKVLVGSYKIDSNWKCVARDRDTLYVATDAVGLRAENKLRALGFSRISCDRDN